MFSNRRFLSLLLSSVLVFSLFPGSALAKTASQDESISAEVSGSLDDSTAKKAIKKTAKKKKKMTKKKLLSSLRKAPASTKMAKVFSSSYKLKKTKPGRSLLKLAKKLNKNDKVSFVMLDLKTGQGVSLGAERTMYSASCLKGPYVVSLNKYLPSSKRKANTMRSTIEDSDNDTYAALRSQYGSKTMRKFMSSVGAKSFSPSSLYTYVKVNDLARLWVGMYWYFYKENGKNSKWCRGLFSKSYMSFIRKVYDGKYTVRTKPGWYPGGKRNTYNDAGIIRKKIKGKSHPYLLVVMSNAYGKSSSLKKLVRSVDAVHTDMVKESK